MKNTDIKIGTKLYLRQFTGSYYIDIVKSPYTVIGYDDNNTIIVQKCKLIAPIYHCVGNPYLDRPDLEGQRVFFYDTVAESIEEDTNGRTKVLSWHPKREMWGTKGKDADYPEYAIFGSWEHQPYLD